MAKPKDKPQTFQRPRGTHDILPDAQPLWEAVQGRLRDISAFYGFGRIDTPHFEDTELFTAGVGRATDIVAKQMYSFKTRGGDELTLRPEGTAAAARAYVEHGMANLPQPVKLAYEGAYFRHESPQRGRFREFHQWGLELIGDGGAVADAEIIHIFAAFLRDWGIQDTLTEVNSIGCPACRPGYRAQLAQYYRSRVRGLCRDCRERYRVNPLRLLDCTQEKCAQVKKSAPQVLDRLCEACRGHFKLLLEFLEEIGVPYVLNPRLVRGLDYYTRTVFETYLEAETTPKPAAAEGGAGAATPPPAGEAPHHGGVAVAGEELPTAEEDRTEEPGRKLAIVSGGRYDGLIELVGGRPTPAVGGAMGMERLIGVIRERKARVPEAVRPKVFLVELGELAKKKSFRIMEELRRAGIPMAESLGRDSIRSQLKVADRAGAPFALIVGQKEALDGMVILREMSSGIQETIPQSKLVETLRRKLKK